MKDKIFLQALKGEYVHRPPVWMMRQAGRYLPEYMALRDKYGFFERCETPELACEITMQPIRRFGMDAAILFSDILVVPQAMGLEVQLVEQIGPYLPDPIKTQGDLSRIIVPDVYDRLHYVMDAIKLIQKELNGDIPLIGFAGSPWTILCYMVQGKGSKTFDGAKQFCYRNPKAAHQLLQMITDTTIAYLKAQIEAGIDAFQVFDSWGGLLSPSDFEVFSLQYCRQIFKALEGAVPGILFSKGAWFALKQISEIGARGIGLDWTVPAAYARNAAGPNVTLQGNLDPAKLLAPIPEIVKATREMLDAFGRQRYIANLGHGIMPNVPLDHARAFVETIKGY